MKTRLASISRFIRRFGFLGIGVTTLLAPARVIGGVTLAAAGIGAALHFHHGSAGADSSANHGAPVHHATKGKLLQLQWHGGSGSSGADGGHILLIQNSSSSSPGKRLGHMLSTPDGGLATNLPPTARHGWLKPGHKTTGMPNTGSSIPVPAPLNLPNAPKPHTSDPIPGEDVPNSNSGVTHGDSNSSNGGAGEPKDDSGSPKGDAGTPHGDSGTPHENSGPSREGSGDSQGDSGTAHDDIGPSYGDDDSSNAGPDTSHNGSEPSQGDSGAPHNEPSGLPDDAADPGTVLDGIADFPPGEPGGPPSSSPFPPLLASDLPSDIVTDSGARSGTQTGNVPEPSTLGLLAIGLIALGRARQRLLG